MGSSALVLLVSLLFPLVSLASSPFRFMRTVCFCPLVLPTPPVVVLLAMISMAKPLLGNQTAVAESPAFHTTASCMSCKRKKVKRDGKQRCLECVEDGTDDWVDRYKRVRPSAWRTESPSSSALALRVRQYEHLLRAHGIDPDGEGEGQADGLMEDSDPVSRQKSMLWSELKDRIVLTLYETGPENVGPPADSTTGFDAEGLTTPELLIWGRPNFVPLRPMHPTVPQVMLLWQAFLNNFDPLVKLFHAPTAQVTVSNAATDLDGISPNTEALMFAIYLSATATMTEQQCVQFLGTPKPALVKRFANGTQQALVNARFLKSADPVVLQALTLYLLASRSYIDKQALWVLAGIAARLGETMGLNDGRTQTSLTLFEAEMRQRLWSQIYLINGCPIHRGGDDYSATSPPSNCNDSDLSPSMTKLPNNSGRGTEMVFCELHRDMGYCLSWLKLDDHRNLASRLEFLAGFDSKLEQLTLKCDPSIPLHLFTLLAGRSVAAQLHFAVQANAHLSEISETDPNILTPRESLLDNAIEILHDYAELRSIQALRPFLWHPIVQFPLDAFVFVLLELRTGVDGDKCSSAWVAVNRVYEDHPEFVTHGENPLYAVAGDLTMLAWDTTVKVGAGGQPDEQDFEGPVESHALKRLRDQRSRKGVSSTGEHGESDVKAEELEWAAWQRMLHDAGYWQGFSA